MLYEQIKQDQLQARKDRNQVKAAVLGTLRGDLENAARAKGMQPPFDGIQDAQVVALVKKFIDGINETKNHLEEQGSGDAWLSSQAPDELAALEVYVPKQLSEGELLTITAQLWSDNNLNELPNKQQLGKVMGLLKAQYAGQYDGQLAKSVIDRMLNDAWSTR